MEGGGWREQLGMQGSEQLSHTRDSVDNVTGEWAVMVAVCHVPRVDRVAVTVGLSVGRGWLFCLWSTHTLVTSMDAGPSSVPATCGCLGGRGPAGAAPAFTGDRPVGNGQEDRDAE